MALMKPGVEPRETRDEINARFGIAQDGRPTDGQLALQADIRQAVTHLAQLVNDMVEDGRNKSLALTHLEDALMRIGKAIFEEPK